MKLSPEEIEVRHSIIAEAEEIAQIYDRILSAIHKTESEKQALKGLRKLKIAMENFERIHYYMGRQN